MLLPSWHVPGDAVGMPDRPFPAVEALIRRVQRVAASRPDPMYILAQTITMTSAIGADPYAVLGVLAEGAVQTIVQQIPAEHQMEAAQTLLRLLRERPETGEALREWQAYPPVLQRLRWRRLQALRRSEPRAPRRPLSARWDSLRR